MRLMAVANADTEAYHHARRGYDTWLKGQGSHAHYALNRYGGSAAFAYNEALRKSKGEHPGKEHEGMHHDLKRALSYPMPHHTSVWRGDTNMHINKLKVGTHFQSHHPLSTSFDPHTAQGFGERKHKRKTGEHTHVYLSKIHVPVGTHVGMPQHDLEKELTLKHRTRFEVTGKSKHTHGNTTYHITHLKVHP